MKKILLGILFISLVITGCKKNITEVPYDFLTADNFPTSSDEADAALIGCYATIAGGNKTWDYTGGLYMCSQNDVTNGGGNWSAFITPTNGAEANWWRDYWKGINAANNLIFALEKRDATKDLWVPRKLAEAHAVRAFFYHNLASLFGDLPFRDKPTNEITLKVERSPVAEIYEKIILPDLVFADGKLLEQSSPSGRISAGGLKCIMADVYMKLAGWRRSSQGVMVAGDPQYWAKAMDAAAAVIAMEADGVYALEPQYSQVFTKLSTDVATKEVIFDQEFTNPDFGSNFPYVFGAPGGGNPDAGSGNANLRFIREWLRTRDDRDERWTWNVGNYRYNGGWTKTPVADTNAWRVATFQKIYPSKGYWQDNVTNWPFFRLSEVKLMYAEAANEVNGGPTAEAYNQINQVRYRARPAAHKTDGTVLPDLAGLTQAQFRDSVMEERAMELINEGKRHLDLVRWGNLKEKIQANESQWTTIINNVGDFNMRYYLWSVPTGEVTTNGWQNNEGY